MADALSIDLGVPNVPTVVDKQLFGALSELYSALRNIVREVDNHTGVTGVTFTDSVAVGQAVNLYNSGGVLTARLAGALTGTKPMRGFCASAANVASGATGIVKLSGTIETLSGLTPGALYYLSDTPGSYSAAPGTTPQAVGFALSATALYINPTLL